MKTMNNTEMMSANAGAYKNYKYLYFCKNCGGAWGTNSWLLKDYRKFQRDAHQRCCFK